MSINAEKSKVFLQIDSIVLFSNTHAILSTIDLYGRNKKKSLVGGGGLMITPRPYPYKLNLP